MITGIIPDGYYPKSSVFTFCNLVDFRDYKKRFLSFKYKEYVVAGTPEGWFRLLKREGCRRIRLFYQSEKASSNPLNMEDYKLAGLVGGGGTWLIETIYDEYSNYWANRWEVTQREAQDKRIWSVNYARLVDKQPTTDMQIPIQQARQKLENSLKEINEFASVQQLDYWAEIFNKARSMLERQNPNSDYFHSDLIVLDNYSLVAQQTLFAAAAAWVFGGMGSWNDLGFQEREDQNQ